MSKALPDILISYSNVFSPITAKNLSNVAIAVQGNLHLPQNITYVQYAPSL